MTVASITLAAATKGFAMFERFNHLAAIDAAREHARLLHVRRLRLSLVGMFDDRAPRGDVDREAAELELREKVLLRFAEDPYHADSLLQIFHAEDRALVLDAGRPSSPSAYAFSRAS